MLDIHTVAAGGGSILHGGTVALWWAQNRRGRSGPACYGKGGPLAVTDCNAVLAGSYQSGFPKCSAPTARRHYRLGIASSLPSASRRAGLRRTRAIEHAAMGFLDVAVETMARAIRVISTERGHDVASHALVSFGGAGGQHACKVARALGMSEVLVPPYSGVLSAVGIGVAEQRVVRQRGLDIPLHGSDERLRDTITAVTIEAAQALEAQHGAVAQVDVRIGLRVMGSDTVLDIDYGANLQARFSTAHAARFGFAPDNAVHIQRVTATARTAAGTLPSPALPKIQRNRAERPRCGWMAPGEMSPITIASSSAKAPRSQAQPSS